MNKLRILLVVACVVLVALSSCKKLGEEIVGTWNVMTFDTKPEGTLQLTFDGNSTAIRVLNNENGMFVDSCNYEVQKKLGKQNLIVTNSKMLPGYDVFSGTYRLDKIKNDVIVLTRTTYDDGNESGAYYRLELKRKN